MMRLLEHVKLIQWCQPLFGWKLIPLMCVLLGALIAVITQAEGGRRLLLLTWGLAPLWKSLNNTCHPGRRRRRRQQVLAPPRGMCVVGSQVAAGILCLGLPPLPVKQWRVLGRGWTHLWELWYYTQRTVESQQRLAPGYWTGPFRVRRS